VRLSLVVLVMGLAGTIGCGNQTTVIVNEKTAEAGAPFVVASLNEQCNTNDDCASSECVPIVGADLPDAGSCWSDSFVGCERVNFPDWVIVDFCGAKALAVCQTALTAEMTANCVAPNGSAAPWIANFQCCDPSFL